jgi:hypothetical protein
MKTDGINPVPSATIYRIFSSVFIFSGINGNRTENGTWSTESGTENSGTFIRPYLRNPVFVESGISPATHEAFLLVAQYVP